MSDISSDLAGHASSRMASVRFTLAMRVSAAIFAALAFGLLVAPRLVLALIGDADDPVIEIALAHVGALFGGLAFLTWRMRMIVARRAQIAVAGGLAFTLALFAAVGLMAVGKGLLPEILLVAVVIEAAWAVCLMLAVRSR